MPSRPSTHSTSSRERLLGAAKRLFAAHGYEQTATSAIARAAGTSESQLMRYFGGKVGLLDALFDAAWEDLNRRMSHRDAGTSSARENLLAILDDVTAALNRDPEQASLFLFEARRVRGGAQRVRLSPGFSAFTDTIKKVVKAGVARGELRQRLDAAAVSAAILGAVESMLRERIVMRAHGVRPFGEKEIHRTIEAMLAGLEEHGAPARRKSAPASRRAPAGSGPGRPSRSRHTSPEGH
jgi:AcrR family transcriptional regulator